MTAKTSIYDQIRAKRATETPIWERKWLTVEEAASYAGIGINKLRELIAKRNCPFVIWDSGKWYIVRVKLEKYLDAQFRI